MLVPQHPRPVVRRRAVPEMTVGYRQAETILPGDLIEAVPLAVVEAPPARAHAEPPLCFAVVYRLPEYLAILNEYLPRGVLAWEQARGRGGSGRLAWGSRAALAVMVPLVGTPMFLLKKRRMPVCRFTIDGERVVREAGGGRLDVAWADVRAVHRLSTAWLIDTGNGGLPIPFRCLGADQRAAFERLLMSRFGHDTPV